jgi:formyl-CoA transferase
VPCGPINRLDEVFNDPQVKARNCAIELAHPSTDSVKLVASPMRMSATPVQYDRAPPLLGQHTDQILHELLGYSEQQLTQLRDKKII